MRRLAKVQHSQRAGQSINARAFESFHRWSKKSNVPSFKLVTVLLVYNIAQTLVALQPALYWTRALDSSYQLNAREFVRDS